MNQIVGRASHILASGNRYFSIATILSVAFLYNYILVPLETKRLEEVPKDIGVMQSAEPVSPTLYMKRPESVYRGVLQSRRGDVYRVVFDVRGGNNPQLEVSLFSSVFHETVKIGEVEAESSDENERKEIVFTTSGSFDSIIIRLKEGERDETKWDNKFAFIENLSITRLDISPEKMTSLAPVVIGVQGMPFAKLEDLGSEMLYTFSTRSDITDYQGIFEATESAAFDGKKKAVVAAKRKGEYFMYKLDAVHPFKKLLIRAIQKGSDKDEIRLQYSFDKSSWQTVEYTQEDGGSQKFLLFIEQEVPKEKVVYVKVFYEGEDKKTGTFGLEELEVNALVVNEGKSF